MRHSSLHVDMVLNKKVRVLHLDLMVEGSDLRHWACHEHKHDLKACLQSDMLPPKGTYILQQSHTS